MDQFFDKMLKGARDAISTRRFNEAEATFRSIRRGAIEQGLHHLEAIAETGLGLCEEGRGDLYYALRHYDLARRIIDRVPLSPDYPAVVASVSAAKHRCLQLLRGKNSD